MRNILVAAIASLAISGIAEARMYKCTDPNGSVTYSERPCEQGTQKAIKLYDSTFTAPTPSRYGTNSAIPGSRTRSSSGSGSGGRGASGPVRVGMTTDEVLANLGRPDTKDDPTYFGGSRSCRDGSMREVWMYKGKNGNLGQKLTICSSTVVDIDTISSGSKHNAGAGSNKFGQTGGSVTAQPGWSRMDVLERMGKPDTTKPMTFTGNNLCPGGARVDTFVYNRRDGNLGQTVIFCNDRVVDVQHN